VDDAAWKPAGRVALRVYPADLLASVRAWAMSHAIRAEDDTGALGELLRRHRIPIASRATPPDVTLYAGPRALQKHASLPPRHGEHAILFTERQSEFPIVIVDRTMGGTVVSVEMPLLERLFDDPLAQKTLVEILRHVSEPNVQGVRR
jgi:hypothetical protein